jgi:hypothetical protein
LHTPKFTKDLPGQQDRAISQAGCRRPEKETIAASAILELRQMFNKGECASVYAEADPAFRSQSEKNWVSQCEQLRHDLGAWQSFRGKGAEQGLVDPRLRLVTGEAVFASGAYHLEMLWNVSVLPARLCFLQLGTDPNVITIPPSKRHGPNDAPTLPPAGWNQPPSLQRVGPRPASAATFAALTGRWGTGPPLRHCDRGYLAAFRLISTHAISLAGFSRIACRYNFFREHGRT